MRPLSAVSVVLALLIVGCSRGAGPGAALTPTAGSSADAFFGPRAGTLALDPFYPLTLGNRWTYRASFSSQVIPLEGAPGPVSTIHSTVERELTCIEAHGGLDYVVEHAIDVDPQATYHSWVRFRQDATGLYEADVAEPGCQTAANAVARGADRSARMRSVAGQALAGLEPVRRAAFARAFDRLERKVAVLGSALGRWHIEGVEGLQPGEITRLAYPLEAGASWVIRDLGDLRFVATVEALELVRLPAGPMRAYRVRIDIPPLTTERDRILVWYSREGFLKLSAHIEGVAVDENGNPIGTVSTDDLEELTGLELEGPGRF